MKKYYTCRKTILDGIHRDRENVYAKDNALYKISCGDRISRLMPDGTIAYNTDIPDTIEASSMEEAVEKLLGPTAEPVKVPEHTPESWLPPDERKSKE